AAMQGVSCAQMFGVSSPRTKAAWEEAVSLLDVLPQHPLRGMVLYGLGLVLMVRGDYAEANTLSLRLHEQAESHHDPIPLMCACGMLGQIKVLQGDYREALAILERGIESCRAVGDGAMRVTFIVDPLVAMYAASSVPLVALGKVSAALAQIDLAQAR